MAEQAVILRGAIGRLERLECSRIVLGEGAATDRSALGRSEALFYTLSGYGHLIAEGAEGEWGYGLRPGMFVWFAPGVGHTFSNTGEGELRLVRFDWAADAALFRPGMGRLVLALENFPAEEEGGRSVRVVFRGPAPEGGQIASVEQSLYFPGGFSPPHRAPGLEEMFYFVRGRGLVFLDGEEIEARPGTVVAVPSGVRHNVMNTGGGVLEHITCNIRL